MKQQQEEYSDVFGSDLERFRLHNEGVYAKKGKERQACGLQMRSVPGQASKQAI
ncbi:MAG: hypothetical protein M3R15_35130 [Acidobacteriota bacterium]|nr:hypothetical protein [Acidobacteriota bacterium]